MKEHEIKLIGEITNAVATAESIDPELIFNPKANKGTYAYLNAQNMIFFIASHRKIGSRKLARHFGLSISKIEHGKKQTEQFIQLDSFMADKIMKIESSLK